MIPHVRRLTEADPRLRRIHVSGELHAGELTARGYRSEGGEFVFDVRRPKEAGADADPFILEFGALQRMGYAFLEGEEWSPAELFRKYREKGMLSGEFKAIKEAK